MKILLSINCSGAHTEGTIVYAEAWVRFLDRHKNELDRFEPLFVNNGLDHTYFSQAVIPYNSYQIIARLVLPFDTETTFWPLHSLKDSDYDYYLRVDHEAFPSVDTLNHIADTLEQNPDITFMTASNFPRSVFHHRDDMPTLDNSTAVFEDRGNFHWEPWGIPTINGDLFVIKRSLFNECLDRYESNTIIQNGPLNIHGAFNTNELKYQDICYILNKEPKGPNVPIYIDGGIRADFWTLMCASPNMKVAGIVDSDGRSFAAKDHLITQYLNSTQHANSFDDIRDLTDISFRRFPLEIQAAYFHMGSGYLADWYLDAQHPKMESTRTLFAPHFQDNNFGNYAAHYAITSCMAKLSKDRSLWDRIEREFIPVLKGWGVTMSKLDAFGDKVLEFYESPLRSYL